MSEAKRAVFLKQSGELLESRDSDGHWGAASKVAVGIAEAYAARKELDIYGLTIVTGAGNIARGETLKKQKIANKYADAIGRWGTIGNALVLAGALESLALPLKLFISSNMDYEDSSLGGHIEKYSPAAAGKAHAEGKVVLIAGGTGEDGVTTDNAVVFYAEDYRKVSHKEILILKSTKYDGVYESDPAEAHGQLPARYEMISAHTIQQENLKVVDKASVKKLIKNNLTMVIYSDAEHSLKEALDPHANVGTIVVPQICEPVLAAV